MRSKLILIFSFLFLLVNFSCEEITQKSSEKDILSFSILDLAATIDGINITLKLPYEVDINNLLADFETSGVSVTVNNVPQVSGQTVNDFSKPVQFKVTAEDGTYKAYLVTVTKALASSNEITSFYIDGQMGATTINHEAGTIKLTMPSFMNITSNAAFFTSNGKLVKIGETPQFSGISKNNFTEQQVYTVSALNGDEKHYIVDVVINSSSDKVITAFSIPNQFGPTSINEENSTIRVMITNQFKASVATLIPTFTFAGYAVYIDETQQFSGITSNNFSEESLPYTVKAPNGDTKT